jgi:predicted RNA-binding Zn-ribbon protein involved in translation (DUF1610 family)
LYYFQVADDNNFPNKICEKCLDRTISSYLFKQQCEKSERAIRNCFDDIFEKLEKLDPLERPKKRGRQKLNPNPNVLYAEHEVVGDYAEPLITLINVCTELTTDDVNKSNFTCSKCTEILPNLESLVNHEKSHPKSMWYHCQQCGKSFAKYNHLKKHLQGAHVKGDPIQLQKSDFKCLDCGFVSPGYNEHLQHIEKHKFKTVMEHLITRKMDKLCAVCLNMGSKFSDMEKIVCLHGGSPDMMGHVTLYNLLGSTVPEVST